MQLDATFTLRQVADLTGLTEFTLRGWEGRYRALVPRRTQTGRRKYTRHDLKKAFLLRELVSSGQRIGDIAKLPISVLEKKFDTHLSPSENAKSQEKSKDEFSELILKLAMLQNWCELKTKFHAAVGAKSPLSAIFEVILPVLSRMGNYVAIERIGIAQEHILSAFIKEQLYSVLAKISVKQTHIKSKMSFVIASPEGDYHELGILVAHVMLSALGNRSLFLGPHTPKNELCETAIRFGASHILLASTYGKPERAGEDIYTYLHYLDQHLPSSTAIWIGGRQIASLTLGFNRKFQLIKSLQEIPELVRNVSFKKKRIK